MKTIIVALIILASFGALAKQAKDVKPVSDAEVIAYLDVIEQFRGAL